MKISTTTTISPINMHHIISQLTTHSNICATKYTRSEMTGELLGENYYIIENNKIFRNEPSPKITHDYTYNQIELLIDSSIVYRKPITSQLPHKYNLIQVDILEFKIHNKSLLKFVVEIVENQPTCYYFIYSNNISFDKLINDTIFIEEFNVFLSYLNNVMSI